ncbi:MAG: helix-turn-helix transcriptional regulator [Clostridia bacterium]|jgi:AraC-like DNA-binding protein|nr:helix-turn-helix transcriptional regulator [Clostridia bacterium]
MDKFHDFELKVHLGSIVFDVMLGCGFSGSSGRYDSMEHKHLFYEIQFFKVGKGTISTAEKTFSVEMGEYCLIAPDLYHSQHDVVDTRLQKYCVRFEYTINEDSDRLPKAETISFLNALSSVTVFHTKDRHNIMNRLAVLDSILIERPFGYCSRILNELSMVILDMLSDIAGLSYKSQYDVLRKSQLQMRTKLIDDFFSQHFASGVTVEQLCNILHMSKSNLNRILRQEYNQSFKQIIIQLRLEQAEYLLKTTDLSVEAIAKRVGYHSLFAFSSLFHRRHECTPTQFRKTQ